jgi:hypothetical protein
MQPTICALAQGLTSIVDELAATGIDVHFGLGRYQEYPIAPFGQPSDVPYERLRDMAPPDTGLFDALRGLQTSGGGDTPEAQLAGLYQSATGAGQDVDPSGSSSGDIAPGQQATFRDDALKVVVNVTDASFHDEALYPGPAWATTLDALSGRGIKQLGVAVRHYQPSSDQVQAQADLERAALATGARAVAPGVDCNGDGSIEVQAGDPLVCPFFDYGSVNLAPAMVGLLTSLRDERLVSLEPTRGQQVVSSVSPESYPNVNVRVPHQLSFDVTYSCSFAQAGETFPVELAARLATEDVATAAAQVRCLGTPVAPITPPTTIAAPFVPPALPPPPPIPLSQGAPAPGSAPVAEAAPAQATAPMAQPAPAPQRQEQPQLALVHVAKQYREQVGMQNAMVRREGGRDPLATARFGLAVGALSMILAWGFATSVMRVRNAEARG